ncbi:MAG: translocation/assembly module TamB domain-containing protein, partial [Verrucomicrobiota bacterium]
MTEKTPAESTPKKRPGCLAWIRRLALAFILLLALALLWLNGPGFRWLAHKYGPDALQKAGFDNSFQVSGTLLGGINLDTLELFSTESPLKHLSATNLQLRYSLFQLKDLTIKSLTADQLTINLDLSQSSPKKEEDPKSQPLELKSLLNKYRPLALPPDLHLKNLHHHVHHDQQNYYQIKNASLAHTPGTNEFLFEPGTLTDFLNASREMDTAKITWLPDEIQVHNLPLTTELKTEALTLHYSPETKLSGQLAYLDSLINFETNLASGGTLDFSGKPLALEPFLKLSPTPELQASANITQLHLKAANLDQAIEDWQAEFTLALDNLSYEKRLIPQATLTLQKNALTLNTLLTFELPEQPGRIALTTELHPENINNPANFWHDSTSQLDTTIASVSRLLNGLQPILKLPLPPDGWPEGSAQLTADLQLIGSNLGPAQANLDFEKLVWGDATLNSGLLQINFTSLTDPISASLQIQESPLSNLQSEASFHPQKQTYKASFQTRNLTAKTLQPFINLSVGKVPLTGSITLDWLGHGDLTNPDSHRGQLELSQTRLSYNRRNPTQLDLSANYEGLRNINLSSLEIREEDFLLQTNLSWNGKRVEIPALEIQKSSQTLLTGNASIPFNIDTFDPKTYFQSTEDWSLNLKADQLDIPATLSLLGLQNQDTPLLPPQLNGIQGTLILDSSLAGSPSLPSLTGRLRLNELNLPEFPQIPPSDTSLAWATAGRSLTLDGTITPDGYQPIVINATSGFHPYKWSENPDTLLNETFDFKATAPELNLAPFAELSPTITLIEGTANIQATGTGTFRNPSFAASLQADIPKIRTTIPRFEKIRATSLDANFTDNTLIIQPFSTSFQGGIMGMSGTILLDEPANPLFDLRIGGSEVLLHRDENINARGDIRLNLDGRLDSARLSGELDLIESVFYKDIELLPLGVPISVPKAPSLPSFRKGNAPPTTTLPIPEPFASWKLDLLATTHDPFRVRGNLTSGEVIGKIKARGILSNPELDGLLLINDFSAALPFSSLSIDGGQVRFRPQLGLLPELEIRATSNIANHDVDIFVNGPSTNPELSFNSNPPLPENEIMTLIATGTTPTGLGDSDTAKGKALQLLIEKVRRAPPGTRLHPFAKFAEPLKDANFEIGGVDPFTGKRRNSVTLPLPFFDSDRWFLSAAIDDQNNTRFLGLYVLRFGDTADSKKTDKTISNLNLPSSSDKPPITQVKLVGLTGLSEQDVFDRLGGRLDFINCRAPPPPPPHPGRMSRPTRHGKNGPHQRQPPKGEPPHPH